MISWVAARTKIQATFVRVQTAFFGDVGSRWGECAPPPSVYRWGPGARPDHPLADMHNAQLANAASKPFRKSLTSKCFRDEIDKDARLGRHLPPAGVVD